MPNSVSYCTCGITTGNSTLAFPFPLEDVPLKFLLASLVPEYTVYPLNDCIGVKPATPLLALLNSLAVSLYSLPKPLTAAVN